MRKSFAALLLVGACLTAVHAGASVVTSIPGGTVIPMPAIACTTPPNPCFGPGPQIFGPGITWSSTNATNGGGAVFGYIGDLGNYDFGSNGYWTGALGPMAGLNWTSDFYPGVVDTMTFAFTSPVSSVGGFLNYYAEGSSPTTIAVYDSGFNLIESYVLSFTTAGGADEGAFYGFQESSATIKYFVLTDNFIGITNLTTAAVPEPGSLLLIGTGLLGAVGYGRRRLGL